MMARPRPDQSKSRGQAMVEFALVAPIFFLLLFLIIEGGRFVFFYEMLNNAAREGARYAIVHGANSSPCPGKPGAGGGSGPPPPGLVNTCDPSGANVKTAVQNAAMNLAGAGELFVYDPIWTPKNVPIPKPADCYGAASPCPGSNARGDYVSVYVEYLYHPVIPILPQITISAEATLVVNN
jgi:hypothetical protein